MKKARVMIIGLLCLFLLIVGGVLRFRAVSGPPVDDGRLQVVATFYPLAEFAKQVGGEDIQLTQLVPDGTEPHEYEPTAQQITLASHADVFLMNGGGVDGWADDIAKAVNDNGGLVVNMAYEVELQGNDPHIWLDPERAGTIVGKISMAIIGRDQAHWEDYAARTRAYTAVLESLDKSYRNELAQCSLRDIITSHDAFGYLGARYTFKVHHILGVSPEEEPSVKAITELAQLAKQLKIKTIFFETLVSPKLAQTLASEVGATAKVLNPIEGLTAEERKAGRSYVDLMLENLATLKTAMMCQ